MIGQADSGRLVDRLILSGEKLTERLKGQPLEPFMFRPRGHLALLGKRTGVAQVGSFTFTGLPAWLLWHAYYLSHIPTWRNRLQLFTNWLLAALLGPETSQLRLK